MVIPGRVQNGVVVLEGGPVLPEGAPVSVSWDHAPRRTPQRIEFPLVHSERPGTLNLTNERIAEILDEEDVSTLHSMSFRKTKNPAAWAGFPA